jgi:phosphoglycolate phosphatase
MTRRTEAFARLFQPEAILWDLDGTLADTADDIAWAVDRTLEAHGLRPLGTDRVRGFIGDGAAKLVDRSVRAAGAAPVAEHLTTFRRVYRERPCGTAALYAGMAEILASVCIPQAVVTNKPGDVTHALLRALEVHHLFAAVVAGDTLEVRKPDPAPVRHAMEELGVRTAVMVGDGPHDVGAARAAGVPCIGVDWGILSPEGADWRIAKVTELAEVLAGLGVVR